jgi:hypothetical protein
METTTSVKKRISSNTQLESFGTMTFYGQLINIVRHNKHHWRKVARFLQKIRRQLKPWPMVDPVAQHECAHDIIVQSLKDTKLPDEIKEALKYGMRFEFKMIL